jgi:D-xylose transport system permease protein
LPICQQQYHLQFHTQTWRSWPTHHCGATTLPVAIGSIIIWTVFSTLNPVLLTPTNLVHLLFECSTVGIIALGMVCVLMVGEIDPSVGSASGFASALLGRAVGQRRLARCGGHPCRVGVRCRSGQFMACCIQPSGHAKLGVNTGWLALTARSADLRAGQGRSINLPYGSPLVVSGPILVMPDRVPTRFGSGSRDRDGHFVGFRGAERRRRAASHSTEPNSSNLLIHALMLTTTAWQLMAFHLNIY